MAGKPPLIVILGPTAIGKTGIAIKIAHALQGEIIGADSRQIYRHMNIGTAKPTHEEQLEIPHYLIDLIDPTDNLTLARFQTMAYERIDEIHQRGKVPLLVGGTGQYISAVTEGWTIPEVPPNDALRDELEGFAATHGSEALHQRLQQVDRIAADKIHPNNVRRVVRALEVSIEVGTPISELQRKKPPPYRILELGLQMERPNLHKRADQRVDQMMTRGFLDEVRRLLDHDYSRQLPSMSGLGYTQLVRHLLDNLPLEKAIEETKIATHQFIRRQYTWFRGHDNGIVWHNVQQIDAQSLQESCLQWLQGDQR